MKLNGQSRSFVKQVQLDLLALGDADLLQTVQQWLEAGDASEAAFDVAEECRLALGYARARQESEAHLLQHALLPGIEDDGRMKWQPPSPQELRSLLTAMDVHMFARHVISLAYLSLHATHPEWYDGMTFNAHLANYLRRLRNERANLGTA